LVSDYSQSPELVKSQANDDKNDEDEDEDDEEEYNLFFQMMKEHGDDIEPRPMTDEEWEEWRKSM
jgi:hypothetical protein